MTSYARRRFTEYGRYFARQYHAHAAEYNEHYGDATGYRRAMARQCWPHVGDHCKRYFREAFTHELAQHS